MICNKCNKHTASESWVGDGGILAWAHGMAQIWCKCCVFKEQLRHAKQMAKGIPRLEKKIAKLKCK